MSWANAGASLSGITAASAVNSINNANNAQTWNWQLTGATNGMNFTENAASTGTGYITNISTLASSTAKPFRVQAQGNSVIDTSAAGVITFGNVTTNPSHVFSGTGTTTFGGSVAVQGGTLSTTQTTANLFNGTATTVNLAGAATTLNVGASTGTTTINNATTNIVGNLQTGGTQRLSNAGALTNITGLTMPSGTVTITPFNTAGGLVQHNSSGVLSSLAIGSAGQVLTVSGGVPAWAAASNIYTADGSLSAARTVTLGANNLTFSAASTGQVNFASKDILVNGITVGRGGGNNSLNTTLGAGALAANTSGNTNIAIGASAMAANTTGHSNTVIGWNSVNSLIDGTFNTVVGRAAAQGLTSGSENVILGSAGMAYLTTGSQNVVLGNSTFAIAGATNFQSIVGVGNAAGSSSGMTGGTGITMLGANSDGPGGTANNVTAVGYQALASASNKIRLGNSAVTVIEGQVAFTFPSDRRLKEEIVDVPVGLDFLQTLRPVAYHRIGTESPKKEYGFIAQEIEQSLADAGVTDAGIITISNDGNTGISDLRTLRMDDMVAPIVRAIQEQQNQLGARTTEIVETLSYMQTLQNEVPINAVDTVVAKLQSGVRIAENFIASRVTAVRGYFDELFTKKIHTELLCVKKSNGTEFCATGDQLEAAVNATGGTTIINNYTAPISPTPAEGSTSGGSTTPALATETPAPVPAPAESTTPTPTPESTPAPDPVITEPTPDPAPSELTPTPDPVVTP
jgi:hypothetical protein